MLDDEHATLSAAMAEAFALQGSAAQLGNPRQSNASLPACKLLLGWLKLSGDAARARLLAT